MPESDGTVEKTTELSERVLKEVKSGQESAIEAVRQFMESVDKALPPRGGNPSRRQEVIDSALEMSEKLVQTQYDFLRNVVHSAGETLGAGQERDDAVTGSGSSEIRTGGQTSALRHADARPANELERAADQRISKSPPDRVSAEERLRTPQACFSPGGCSHSLVEG